MRGNPPLHLTLALIGFMLLAIPLAKLTFARTDSKPLNHSSAAPIENTTAVGCLLRIRFEHAPKILSVLCSNKVVLETKNAGSKSPVEQNIRLEIPKDGIEFNVTAEWPDGTPDTVLTIELEPDGLDARSAFRWSSNNRMNEIISFTW